MKPKKQNVYDFGLCQRCKEKSCNIKIDEISIPCVNLKKRERTIVFSDKVKSIIRKWFK